MGQWPQKCAEDVAAWQVEVKVLLPELHELQPPQLCWPRP